MIKNIFLVFVSALLLYLSGPKADLFLLAWVALVPLFYVLYKAKNKKSSFLYGYLFGVFFFAFMFFWINGLNKYGGLLAHIGWVFQALFLGLYFGLFSFLFYYIKREKNFYIKIFSVPSLWILIEFLRSITPFGVTVYVGYSQWLWKSLIQVCSVTGMLGLSFIIIYLNNLLALIVTDKGAAPKGGSPLKRAFIIFFIVLVSILFFGRYRMNSKLINNPKLKAALIQTNFTIKEKMRRGNFKYMKEKCFFMTRKALMHNPDIIIWPETALLPILMHENPAFLDELKSIIKDTVFISGTWRSADRGQTYNSSVIVEKGEIVGWQDKTNLVPFGEYLPLRNILLKIPLFGKNPFFSYDLSARKEIKAIKTSKADLGILICIDSIFPETVRSFVNKGINLAITITNDAWYGKSTALDQHILHGVFRAVENKINFIQVANTGISAVINPFGQFIKKSQVNKDEVIVTDVYLTSPKTIYSRFGNWFVIIPFLFLGWCLVRCKARCSRRL